ncbi:MAG: Rrf2 family transcriptional regulator [Candidatus Neomarinimicrobiota bacterium]
MLKLTRKVEYALIALRHLQDERVASIISAKEIADTYEIPTPLLAKILQQLAREKIIEPIQGPHGGYRLKISLDSIKLTDFIEMLEGPLGLVNCFHDANCDLVTQCNIREPIEKINSSLFNLFANMTIADITGEKHA